MTVDPEKVAVAVKTLQQYAGLAEMEPWEIFAGGMVNPYQIVSVLRAQSVLLLDMHERLQSWEATGE